MPGLLTSAVEGRRWSWKTETDGVHNFVFGLQERGKLNFKVSIIVYVCHFCLLSDFLEKGSTCSGYELLNNTTEGCTVTSFGNQVCWEIKKNLLHKAISILIQNERLEILTQLGNRLMLKDTIFILENLLVPFVQVLTVLLIMFFAEQKN